MADDLARVLDLLHGSGHRWRTLRAEGTQWFHAERSREAFVRSTSRGAPFEPPDHDPSWKAWLRQPGQSRVDYGGPHSTRHLVIADGDRICTSHPRAGYNIRHSRGGRPDTFLGPAFGLLQPFLLPAVLDLEVVEEGRFLGRGVVVARGRPRGPMEQPDLWMTGGADEMEVAVDAERGVLLSLEARFAGHPIRRTAMTEVAFDEDLDHDLFAFPEGPDAPPPVPPLPAREPIRRVFGPPDDILGRAVAETVVVARTPDVVVAVDRITAYPTGFEFEVTVRTRDDPVHGSFDRLRRRTWGGTSAFPGESLRVGVEYADGGDVTLLPVTGSGTQARFDQRFWVAPLPPPGPVGVVVEWESRGLAETRADLDGAAIVAAAEHAEALWS